MNTEQRSTKKSRDLFGWVKIKEEKKGRKKGKKTHRHGLCTNTVSAPWGNRSKKVAINIETQKLSI